jgi:hypothetical protein
VSVDFFDADNVFITAKLSGRANLENFAEKRVSPEVTLSRNH